MKTYKFFINSKAYYIDHDISKATYDKWSKYLAVWPRGVIYFVFFLYRLVGASRKEPEFVEFVNKIKDAVKDLPTEDKIRGVVSLVRRNTTYSHDITAHKMAEYWATSPETMYLGLGDCDDFAIMMASILVEMNIDCMFVVMRTHLSIAVAGNFTGTAFERSGKKYFYVDSTNKTSDVGVVPSSYTDVWKMLVKSK
jgi:hypothetical protein